MPSGRKKPAPQPLSLYDPSKATAQNHSRDYYNVSTDPDATSSTASGLSPIDSRSPNSGGTSPSFRSKFATKKRPQTAKSGSNNPEFDPHNDYHRPSHPSLDPLNQPEAPPFSPITSSLDQPKGPLYANQPTRARSPRAVVSSTFRNPRGLTTSFPLILLLPINNRICDLRRTK
uniref:Uncharacterized protein n=1 Tax=Bionectria ochroleuca TaxID=29856 RepID=A0A8H7N9X8_BIOOC